MKGNYVFFHLASNLEKLRTNPEESRAVVAD